MMADRRQILVLLLIVMAFGFLFFIRFARRSATSESAACPACPVARSLSVTSPPPPMASPPPAEAAGQPPASAVNPTGVAAARPTIPPVAVPVMPPPPAVPAVASPKVADDAPREPAAAVAWFKNAGVPIEKREAAVSALAQRGAPDDVRALMQLGADEGAYLNFAAVAALGRIRTPETIAYLEGRLAQPDPKVLAAAVRSLGQAAGAAALKRVGETLKANRRREDGYQDVVCAACVETLGALRSAQAIPFLQSELEETVGGTLQHDYGSKVVRAVVEIGDPAGKAALLAYAEKLTVQKNGMADNPMGQKYLEDRIQEARSAAEQLGR